MQEKIFRMNGAGGGEIVQVQGGHILRSTGRKDRQSKVYTAKGPRDRRVRLSAHTAIQFYDVEDRLGYDRSSKAVDWLIKKAKNAIDKLTELPPWNPNDGTVATNIEPDQVSSAMALEQPSESSSGYEFQLKTQLGVDQRSNSEFIPPPAETECIADTMKSFFPTSSETSLMNFLNYPHDVTTRASIHTADLDLSLHTLQEPISNNRPLTDQVHLSGSSPLTFDGENGDNRMGFILNSQSITQEAMFCQSSAVNPQTEALQSNFARLIRSWDNRSLPSEDNSLISTSQFISEFQAPARIESEDDPGMVPLRPSSSSPISH